MADVYIHHQTERSVRRRHPWVFSGGVAKVTGNPGPGDVVRVLTEGGEFLAWGHYSPWSRIRVRLLDWQESVKIDDAWWQAKVEAACKRRSNILIPGETDAGRIVFSEADLMPGLIVDWYDGWCVLQALSVGVDRIKQMLADLLMASADARGVWERSDAEVRKLEGLEPSVGLLAGERPPDNLDILENGHRFRVDLAGGQKTGFFLDLGPARKAVARYAAGRNVLDCFAFTHAFSVYLGDAGAASVTRIESSADAAALGQANLDMNGLANLPGETIVGDVFAWLRKLRDQGKTFDMIILDPPKFAPTKAQASKAARAYKDINLLAMKLLVPGGLLASFSCSGGIDAELFQQILFGAALDAGRDVQILERYQQGPDHPVLLSCPETMYLKGLLCRVI